MPRPEGTTTTWFPSKVDAWVPVVMFSHLPILTAVLWSAPAEKRLTGVLVATAATLLSAWFIVGTGYRVEPERLVARSGPIRWRIPWSALRSIGDADGDLTSGPAMSLDRIELRYGDGQSMLVSPKDRAGFLQAVKDHAPHCTIAVR